MPGFADAIGWPACRVTPVERSAKLSKPILAAAAFAALAFAVPAHAKDARCVIDSEGSNYSGPCNYTVAKGGTFTVTAPHGRGFGGGTLSIT